MIKVSFLYPNEPGKNFDLAYYTDTYLPLVRQRLEPMGLLRSEVESGISSADPNAPAPFVAVGSLYFSTVDEVHEGFKAHGRELLGAMPNFTDLERHAVPIQISEVV